MFGNRLRMLRENSGMTQEELGKKLNLVKSNISMYEKGNRVPNADILDQLSALFDVSVDYLLGKTETKKYNTPYNNELEKNLFIKIKKLNEKEKDAILNIVHLLGDK